LSLRRFELRRHIIGSMEQARDQARKFKLTRY
jgi:hypothetical protein